VTCSHCFVVVVGWLWTALIASRCERAHIGSQVVTEDGDILRTIHRKPQVAVVRAARGGDAAAVRAALQAPGAGPNARAPDHPSSGSTALHLAATRGHVDVVRELVAADAHLEMRDAEGTTPLQRALDGRRPGCAAVAALIDAELCARAAAAGTHREPCVPDAARKAEEAEEYAAATRREGRALLKIAKRLESSPACRAVSLFTLLGGFRRMCVDLKPEPSLCKDAEGR
jgi:hypothetical protein